MIQMLQAEGIAAGRPYDIMPVEDNYKRDAQTKGRMLVKSAKSSESSDLETEEIEEFDTYVGYKTTKSVSDSVIFYKSVALSDDTFDTGYGDDYFRDENYTPVSKNSWASDTIPGEYVLLKNISTDIIVEDPDSGSSVCVLVRKINSIYQPTNWNYTFAREINGAWNGISGKYTVIETPEGYSRVIDPTKILSIVDNKETCLVIRLKDIGTFDVNDSVGLYSGNYEVYKWEPEEPKIESFGTDDNENIIIGDIPGLIDGTRAVRNQEFSNNIISDQRISNPELKVYTKCKAESGYDEQHKAITKALSEFENLYNTEIEPDWQYITDFSFSKYDPFTNYYAENDEYYKIKPRYVYLHARIKDGKLEFGFYNKKNNYCSEHYEVISEGISYGDQYITHQNGHINDIFGGFKIASKAESEKMMLKNGKLLMSTNPQFAGYIINRGFAEVELHRIDKNEQFYMPYYGHIWTYWYTIIGNTLYFVGLPLYNQDQSSYIKRTITDDGVKRTKKYLVDLPFTESELIDAYINEETDTPAGKYLAAIWYIGEELEASETSDRDGDVKYTYDFNFGNGFNYVSFLNDTDYVDYDPSISIVDKILVLVNPKTKRIETKFHGDILESAASTTISYPYYARNGLADYKYFKDEFGKEIAEAGNSIYKAMAVLPRVSRAAYKPYADWYYCSGIELDTEYTAKLTCKLGSETVEFEPSTLSVSRDEEGKLEINGNDISAEPDNKILANVFESSDGEIYLYIFPNAKWAAEDTEFYDSYEYALYNGTEKVNGYGITREEIEKQHYPLVLIGEVMSGFRFEYNKSLYGFEISNTAANISEYLKHQDVFENDKPDIVISDKILNIAIDIEYYNYDGGTTYDAVFKPVFLDFGPDYMPPAGTKYTWILRDHDGNIVATHTHVPSEENPDSDKTNYCYWNCVDILKYNPEKYTVELTVDEGDAIGTATAIVQMSSNTGPVVVSKDFDLEIYRTNVKLESDSYNLDLVSNILTKDYIPQLGTEYHWSLYVEGQSEPIYTFGYDSTDQSIWPNIEGLEYDKRYYVVLDVKDPDGNIADAKISWIVDKPKNSEPTDLTLAVDIERDNTTLYEDSYSADFIPHLRPHDEDVEYNKKADTVYKWVILEVEYDESGNIISEIPVADYTYNSRSDNDECVWHVDNLEYDKHYIIICDVTDPDGYEGQGRIDSYITESPINPTEDKTLELEIEAGEPEYIDEDHTEYVIDLKPTVIKPEDYEETRTTDTTYTWVVKDEDGNVVGGTTYTKEPGDHDNTWEDAGLDDGGFKSDEKYRVELTVEDEDGNKGYVVYDLENGMLTAKPKLDVAIELEINWRKEDTYCADFVPVISDGSEDYKVKAGTELTWVITDKDGNIISNTYPYTYISGSDDPSVLEDVILRYFDKEGLPETYYVDLYVKEPGENGAEGFARIEVRQDKPVIPEPESKVLNLILSRDNVVWVLRPAEDTLGTGEEPGYFNDIGSHITNIEYVKGPGRTYDWKTYDDYEYETTDQDITVGSEEPIMESDIIGKLKYNKLNSKHYYYTALKVVDKNGCSGYVKIRYDEDEIELKPTEDLGIKPNIRTDITGLAENYYTAAHTPYFQDDYKLKPESSVCTWELIDTRTGLVVDSYTHTCINEEDECIWYSQYPLEYGIRYYVNLVVTDADGKYGTARNEIYSNRNNIKFQVGLDNIEKTVVNRITESYDAEIKAGISLKSLDEYATVFDISEFDITKISYIGPDMLKHYFELENNKFVTTVSELRYLAEHQIVVNISGRINDNLDPAKPSDYKGCIFGGVYVVSIGPENPYEITVLVSWSDNTANLIIRDNSPVGTKQIDVYLDDIGVGTVTYTTENPWTGRGNFSIPDVTENAIHKLRVVGHEVCVLTTDEPPYGPYNNRIDDYSRNIITGNGGGNGGGGGGGGSDDDDPVIIMPVGPGITIGGGGGGGGNGTGKNPARVYYYVFVGNKYAWRGSAAGSITNNGANTSSGYNPYKLKNTTSQFKKFYIYKPTIRNLLIANIAKYTPGYPKDVTYHAGLTYPELDTNGIDIYEYTGTPYKKQTPFLGMFEYECPEPLSLDLNLTHTIRNGGTYGWIMAPASGPLPDPLVVDPATVCLTGPNVIGIEVTDFSLPSASETGTAGTLGCNIVSLWTPAGRYWKLQEQVYEKHGNTVETKTDEKLLFKCTKTFEIGAETGDKVEWKSSMPVSDVESIFKVESKGILSLELIMSNGRPSIYTFTPMLTRRYIDGKRIVIIPYMVDYRVKQDPIPADLDVYNNEKEVLLANLEETRTLNGYFDAIDNFDYIDKAGSNGYNENIENNTEPDSNKLILEGLNELQMLYVTNELDYKATPLASVKGKYSRGVDTVCELLIKSGCNTFGDAMTSGEVARLKREATESITRITKDGPFEPSWEYKAEAVLQDKPTDDPTLDIDVWAKCRYEPITDFYTYEVAGSFNNQVWNEGDWSTENRHHATIKGNQSIIIDVGEAFPRDPFELPLTTKDWGELPGIEDPQTSPAVKRQPAVWGEL